MVKNNLKSYTSDVGNLSKYEINDVFNIYNILKIISVLLKQSKDFYKLHC